MLRPTIAIAESRPGARASLSGAVRRQFTDVRLDAIPDLPALEARLRKVPPDCLIVDAGGEIGKLGPPIGRKLRKTAPDCPALWVFPRGTDLRPWMPVLRAGPGDFLVRPFSADQLAARIRFCLASGGHAELQRANRVLAGLVEARSHDLYESDERFRLLFNSCSDGIFTVVLPEAADEERIVEVNLQMCHALSYPREEFLAMLPKDLLEPAQVNYVMARLRNLGTQKLLYLETILVTRDGKKLPVAMTARHFSFKRQPYILFVVRFRARPRHGDNAPGGLDHGYGAFAAQTGQIMYEYNLRAQTIRLTGATRQITGHSREELESLDRETRQALIHEDDRREVLRRLNEAVRELGEYQLQYRVRHSENAYRHVEDHGIVLPDETGAPYRMLGCMRDITDRVRAEQEERLIEQEIQHSKRLESLGVLAGGIAHDFNNILAAIIGLTDMSIRELDGPPDVLEDLEESLRAAHRAKDLVKQILAFSRQTGEERSPVHLHVVVREALGLLRASIPPAIHIIDSIDVHSGMVLANPTQMHQVVMNYCTNGIQAMSEKGGTLEVRLEDVEVTRRFAATHPKLHPGPYVKLTVADKGHGIDPGNIKRIFDPFYTTKGPGEGTGMGLAMVYGIVADHGGAVLVESVVGQGTEFQTYLPRTPAEEHPLPGARAVEAPGRESLLVVDDEHAVRRFCQRCLTPLGYKVQTRSNPRNALADFKRDPRAFDLVIADQHMPEMSGDALARRMRKLRPDIPIILFTGFSNEVSEGIARDAGIAEIVSKPVVSAQLTGAVRRVLDAAYGPRPAQHEEAAK
ncbi:MAG: response regulator [Candidatus Hydrogenedentes bacterium]|nr:response regulator [Candidatus Hydrogenedentota bacterium]